MYAPVTYLAEARGNTYIPTEFRVCVTCDATMFAENEHGDPSTPFVNGVTVVGRG